MCVCHVWSGVAVKTCIGTPVFVGRVDPGDQPVQPQLEVAADAEAPLRLGGAGDAELPRHCGEALEPAAGQAAGLAASINDTPAYVA